MILVILLSAFVELCSIAAANAIEELLDWQQNDRLAFFLGTFESLRRVFSFEVAFRKVFCYWTMMDLGIEHRNICLPCLLFHSIFAEMGCIRAICHRLKEGAGVEPC